ncbi:ABC transporter substrate-binding protein [Nocardioides sp. NPDC006273]|uniref:ABC transporter substrate-binding protein n=1 Tax=Nocardioides sp. NPDC006273 TaxID=3155598 RepID=UPI0033B91B2F
MNTSSNLHRSGLILDRRRFLGLSALGISAAALSACGGGPSTTGGGNGRSTVEQIDFSGVKPAKEITFWTSNPGDSIKVSTEIVDAFNSSQSDIRVKLVTAGADYEEIAQKFQTAQTGGDLPDIINLSDVWWFRYKMNDQIIPLDSLFEALEFDTDDYVDSLLGDYLYDDAHWAVPWARSTPLFYYNKDHWKKAGLSDQGPATWEEFDEWKTKLASASGAKFAFQLPALAGYAGWTMQNNLWGWGGGWSKEESFDITCSSAEAVEAISFLKDWVYKDKVAGVAGVDQIQDFAAGVASATVGSTGDLITAITSAKFDVGVAPLPAGPVEAERISPTGGSGVGIPKDISPERQLAAGTFIKFLTEPEQAIKFSEATGYVPIRKSADPAAIVKKTPQAQVAIDQLPNTRSQDYARVFLPGGDLEMANHMATILTENKDVQTELDSLKTALEKIYTDQVEPLV